VITEFHGNAVPDAHEDGRLRVTGEQAERGSRALPFVAGNIAEMFVTHAFLFLDQLFACRRAIKARSTGS
jgi:hypothetical protein